jgi:hypothetical protein
MKMAKSKEYQAAYYAKRKAAKSGATRIGTQSSTKPITYASPSKKDQIK